MKRRALLRHILALLLIVAWVGHWRLVPWFLGNPLSVGGIVFLTYATLSIAATAGLVLGRRWGFYSFYAAVLFGTIMLSVKFIPISLGFLPERERWIGLAVLNLIVLIAGALAHYLGRVDDSKALSERAAVGRTFRLERSF